MTTSTTVTSNERRALLERRANVRLERLGRLVEALGRRRVAIRREATTAVALAVGGFALMVVGTIVGIVYARRLRLS